MGRSAIASVGSPTDCSTSTIWRPDARDAGRADGPDHGDQDHHELLPEIQLDPASRATKSAAALVSAVPSMLTVAPSGTTKPETSQADPSLSRTQRSVTGRVAALELVAKAIVSASRAPRQKRSGPMPVTLASTAARRPP